MRGADFERIYESSFNGNWFTSHMYALSGEPPDAHNLETSLDLEVMFRHGLDPNTRAERRTLWEQLLDAVRANIEMYGPLISESNTYYDSSHHTVSPIRRRSTLEEIGRCSTGSHSRWKIRFWRTGDTGH
jgi:hypothetical protein